MGRSYNQSHHSGPVCLITEAIVIDRQRREAPSRMSAD